MTDEEKEIYDRGYAQGRIQGKVDERAEREKSDGCVDCKFIKCEEWEMPCVKCSNNYINRWRKQSSEEKPSEPTMLRNDTAYIVPHLRNKNGLGYVIAPDFKSSTARVLTESEMSVLLSVYTALLKGRNEVEKS